GEGKEELLEIGIRSLMLVPILQSGKVTGAIGLHQCDNVRQWKEAEIDLVRSVAAQVSVAIHNAQLFRRIADSQRQWQRTFDSMTDGVAMLDADNRVIRANYALLHMSDYKRWDELLGRKCSELFQLAPGSNGDTDPIAEAFHNTVSSQNEIQDVRGRILR